MVVTLAIHAAIIIGALFFVTMKVVVRPKVIFMNEKKTHRPRLPLKKLQVPVNVKNRKIDQPRLRKPVLSMTEKFVEIKMPEVFGVKGDLGNMGGGQKGGLGTGGTMDFFGSNLFGGVELVGTFYDLKVSNSGKPVQMDTVKYLKVLRHFATRWYATRLNSYFKAPTKKYASFFMTPYMEADAAPRAYGVEKIVKPKYWVALYTGEFAAPEAGEYRFCGLADDILMVRVDGDLVIDANYHYWQSKITDWKSTDENNRTYPLLNQQMVIGDWFRLKKGRSTKIEVLIGECPGGEFYCQLMIEQKGKEYRQVPFSIKIGGETVSGIRPVLPVFKIKEIPQELIQEMGINTNEVTIEGPTFGVIK